MAEDSRQQVDTPIRVDIVSDVVCPWCIVGFKQLERAQAETEIPLVVHWHPFELNPALPDGGQDLFQHIAEKYGATLEASLRTRRNLTALGQSLGFTFDFADNMRIVNTFHAHQVIHWAGSRGQQHAMKMALFEAYFSKSLDVSNPETLANVAASIGLDRDETSVVIADGRFADDVRRHEAFWTERGITGVPAMVFGGCEALIGAQGVEAYRTMLLQMASGNPAATLP